MYLHTEYLHRYIFEDSMLKYLFPVDTPLLQVPKVEIEQDMDFYFNAYKTCSKGSTPGIKRNSADSGVSDISGIRRRSKKSDTPSKRRVSMLLDHARISTATRDSSDFRIIVQPHLGSIDSTEVAQDQDVPSRLTSVRYLVDR